MTEVIKFQADVNKVQTLADGGIRITLDLSEKDIETASKLMQVRQGGGYLEIAAVPVKAKRGRNGKKQEFTDDSSPTY